MHPWLMGTGRSENGSNLPSKIKSPWILVFGDISKIIVGAHTPQGSRKVPNICGVQSK